MSRTATQERATIERNLTRLSAARAKTIEDLDRIAETLVGLAHEARAAGWSKERIRRTASVAPITVTRWLRRTAPTAGTPREELAIKNDLDAYGRQWNTARNNKSAATATLAEAVNDAAAAGYGDDQKLAKLVGVNRMTVLDWLNKR